MDHIPFPPILEEEIVAAISKPFTESKRVTKYIAGSDEYVDEFPESTRTAVCDLDVAEYIVSILGTTTWAKSTNASVTPELAPTASRNWAWPM